ncbi:unnamed protein product [Orchesella dallaii]|uniref:HTH CENPB-type domain-containing protein n=1 Tax=Orchesella dallaii TaxID=48710 RepID=A0ABP1Q0T9_9HEXA
MNSPLQQLSQITTLRFDDYEPECEEEYEDEIEEDEPTGTPFYLKLRAVEYWMSGRNGKLKWTTVQNRYRFITSERQLYAFKEQVDRNGDRLTKFKQIREKTLADFEQAIANRHAVHDMDIARWARKHAKAIGLPGFKACPWWVWKFKRTNRICSRKITKVVTSNDLKNDQENLKLANEFRVRVRSLITDYLPTHVFNSDQSGFNYEFASKRSLQFKGTKDATVLVSSINATTHSYTIQPITTLEGDLITPLFICLQEPSGKFGPIVKKGLFTCNNVVAECSKSGKLNKELVRNWFENAFLPATSSKSLLLLDSWSGHDEKVCVLATAENPCKIEKIPPRTTAIAQPLDVYFFRQWKILTKKIYDRVSLDNLTVNLKERSNIIKMQSLIHYQLSSPVFKKMIQYSWFKAGYLEDDPGRFQNVNEVCFTFKEDLCVQDCSQCSEGVFLLCSWCRNPLCFSHFFTAYHNCSGHSM